MFVYNLGAGPRVPVPLEGLRRRFQFKGCSQVRQSERGRAQRHSL